MEEVELPLSEDLTLMTEAQVRTELTETNLDIARSIAMLAFLQMPEMLSTKS